MIANYQSIPQKHVSEVEPTEQTPSKVKFQQYRVFRYVVGLTLAIVLLNVALPSLMGRIEPFLVVAFILVLGIPHGSTDLNIFKALVKRPQKRHALYFGAGYIGLIGLYLTVWSLLPVWAFGVFLLMSLYHFGQSNLAFVKYPNSLIRTLHFLVWGAGVLLIPIFLHPQDAQDIVAAMTGFAVPIPARETLLAVNLIIIALNFAGFGMLLSTGRVDSSIFIREMVHFNVLLVLFYNTSLLMSFTIYFVFWHSLSSILDQNNFFSRRIKGYHWKDFLVKAIPIIFIGIIALAGIAWLMPAGIKLSADLMGKIFIALSLLTLPHMLLVDRLYHHHS